jgi:hypothetical protein
MSRPRFIEIDGRGYLWRDLVRLYREQCRPATTQPTLFALRDDSRPPAERHAAERYREPSLFTWLEPGSHGERNPFRLQCRELPEYKASS